MAATSLRRLVKTGLLIAAVVIALPGATAAQSDSNYVEELVVVAPADGPAWWKVSKGDAVVWVLGLPMTTPRGLQWDKTTLKRRLKGARLMVGVGPEGSSFRRDADPPLAPLEFHDEIATLSFQFRNRLAHKPTVEDALRLQGLYYNSNGLGLFVNNEVNSLARRAHVPIVTQPVATHVWDARALPPGADVTRRCVAGVLAEVTVPKELYRKAGELWAIGDVRGMLAVTPPEYYRPCEHLWGGIRERTIAFQTSLIAQALERPGKVVAIALIPLLVERDGILERLRAQGYTVSDPSKPLEE